MNTFQSSELLSRSDAAAYLKICRTTLDRLNIPRLKIRRRVFYRLETIKTWIDASEQLKGEPK